MPFQHDLLDVSVDLWAGPLGGELLPHDSNCLLKLGVSLSSTAIPGRLFLCLEQTQTTEASRDMASNELVLEAECVATIISC